MKTKEECIFWGGGCLVKFVHFTKISLVEEDQEGQPKAPEKVGERFQIRKRSAALQTLNADRPLTVKYTKCVCLCVFSDNACV